MRTVSAYRDRYGITGSTPLGTAATTTAQEGDVDRAMKAIALARRLASSGVADLLAPPRVRAVEEHPLGL